MNSWGERGSRGPTSRRRRASDGCPCDLSWVSKRPSDSPQTGARAVKTHALEAALRAPRQDHSLIEGARDLGGGGILLHRATGVLARAAPGITCRRKRATPAVAGQLRADVGPQLHESFAASGPRPARQRLLSGSCSSARSCAPRFLPTLGHPHAVALRFTRCDQFVEGLAPAGERPPPCRAHEK